MASASLSPFNSNAVSVSFSLVSTSATGASYQASGRDLSLPYKVQIDRKIGPSGAAANDHVVMKISRIEKNVTTAKLATGSVQIDISVPRDSAALTKVYIVEMLGIASSLLNDNTALAATSVARTALAEGRDL